MSFCDAMKKRDFLLIGSILAVSFLLFAVFGLIRREGAFVVVRVDGETVGSYDLYKNGEYVLNGGTNILKIEDGEAWIVEADCPQISGKKCTAQGKISKTGEVITCLPNKLTVTVYGEDDGVDLVVG